MQDIIDKLTENSQFKYPLTGEWDPYCKAYIDGELEAIKKMKESGFVWTDETIEMVRAGHRYIVEGWATDPVYQAYVQKVTVDHQKIQEATKYGTDAE